MFSSDQSLSSKRIFGAIGFLVCLGCLIFETITIHDILPDEYEITLTTSASLIGLESMANIFNKSKN